MNIPTKSVSMYNTLQLPVIDEETNEPCNREIYKDGWLIRYKNGLPQDSADGLPAIERCDGIAHYEHVVDGMLHAVDKPAIFHHTKQAATSEFWRKGLLINVEVEPWTAEELADIERNVKCQ